MRPPTDAMLTILPPLAGACAALPRASGTSPELIGVASHQHETRALGCQLAGEHESKAPGPCGDGDRLSGKRIGGSQRARDRRLSTSPSS